MPWDVYLHVSASWHMTQTQSAWHGMFENQGVDTYFKFLELSEKIPKLKILLRKSQNWEMGVQEMEGQVYLTCPNYLLFILCPKSDKIRLKC